MAAASPSTRRALVLFTIVVNAARSIVQPFSIEYCETIRAYRWIVDIFARPSALTPAERGIIAATSHDPSFFTSAVDVCVAASIHVAIAPQMQVFQMWINGMSVAAAAEQHAAAELQSVDLEKHDIDTGGKRLDERLQELKLLYAEEVQDYFRTFEILRHYLEVPSSVRMQPTMCPIPTLCSSRN